MAIRVVVSGIGNRALPKDPERSNWLGWVELMRRSPEFEVVGAHDPADVSRCRMIERGVLPAEKVFADLGEMLVAVEADAMLVASPAEYHAGAVRAALEAGLHVLVEKPYVTDVAEGRELVALAAERGLTIAVVQNWRTKDVGQAARAAVGEGKLGTIGHVFLRYVRDRENPNLPAYLFDEPYPLLYAMGIHHLDFVRYVLGEDVAEVSGHAFRPDYSVYNSATGLSLFMRTESGTAVSYTGTFSSHQRGIPQESLVIEGEEGTLLNDSDWSEPPLKFFARGEREPVDLTAGITATSMVEQYDVSDALILDDFGRAVASGSTPICSGEDGLKSVIVLEAARRACETGGTVKPAEIG